MEKEVEEEREIEKKIKEEEEERGEEKKEKGGNRELSVEKVEEDKSDDSEQESGNVIRVNNEGTEQEKQKFNATTTEGRNLNATGKERKEECDADDTFDERGEERNADSLKDMAKKENVDHAIKEEKERGKNIQTKQEANMDAPEEELVEIVVAAEEKPGAIASVKEKLEVEVVKEEKSCEADAAHEEQRGQVESSSPTGQRETERKAKREDEATKEEAYSAGDYQPHAAYAPMPESEETGKNAAERAGEKGEEEIEKDENEKKEGGNTAITEGTVVEKEGEGNAAEDAGRKMNEETATSTPREVDLLKKGEEEEKEEVEKDRFAVKGVKGGASEMMEEGDGKKEEGGRSDRAKEEEVTEGNDGEGDGKGRMEGRVSADHEALNEKELSVDEKASEYEEALDNKELPETKKSIEEASDGKEALNDEEASPSEAAFHNEEALNNEEVPNSQAASRGEKALIGGKVLDEAITCDVVKRAPRGGDGVSEYFAGVDNEEATSAASLPAESASGYHDEDEDDDEGNVSENAVFDAAQTAVGRVAVANEAAAEKKAPDDAAAREIRRTLAEAAKGGEGEDERGPREAGERKDEAEEESRKEKKTRTEKEQKVMAEMDGEKVEGEAVKEGKEGLDGKEDALLEETRALNEDMKDLSGDDDENVASFDVRKDDEKTTTEETKLTGAEGGEAKGEEEEKNGRGGEVSGEEEEMKGNTGADSGRGDVTREGSEAQIITAERKVVYIQDTVTMIAAEEKEVVGHVESQMTRGEKAGVIGLDAGEDETKSGGKMASGEEVIEISCAEKINGICGEKGNVTRVEESEVTNGEESQATSEEAREESHGEKRKASSGEKSEAIKGREAPFVVENETSLGSQANGKEAREKEGTRTGSISGPELPPFSSPLAVVAQVEVMEEKEVAVIEESAMIAHGSEIKDGANYEGQNVKDIDGDDVVGEEMSDDLIGNRGRRSPAELAIDSAISLPEIKEEDGKGEGVRGENEKRREDGRRDEEEEGGTTRFQAAGFDDEMKLQ